MGKLFRPKSNTNSLFAKLITNFAVMIILFIVFGILTFAYYRANLHGEIINYNYLNLRKTIDSYETHINLVRTQALGLYANEQIQPWNATRPEDKVGRNNFDFYSGIRGQMQNIMSNPLLYIDNLFLYFKNPSTVIERGGASGAQDMFTKFYVSEQYPLSFWQSQFEDTESFRIFPAAPFKERVLGANETDKGWLIPVILRNRFTPDFYVAALIDAKRLFDTSHFSINDNFYIMNDDGTLFFSANSAADIPLVKLTGQTEPQFIEQADYYYFYQKGGNTGLTYINVIPIDSITSHFLPQYKVLLALLVLFLMISIAASVVLSMKLNTPVQQMVKLIRQTNATDLPHTDIREFAFINENLRDVMQSNKRILQSLSEQSSLLTYLGYMNQLKNIPPTGRLQQLTFHNNPYRLVLFRLHFKPRAGTPGDDLDFDKAGYFIKEYIDRTFRGAPELPESLTFQMAADQIVALAFIGEQEQVQDPLPSLLARLNDVFKNDEAFYFVTICVSSVYRQSSELTGAYEQTLQMLESRKLNEESQIIDKPEQRKADIVFHGSELQKFEANLAAGNHSAIVTIVEQLFRALHKKQSWAADYRRLAEEVVDSVIKCAKTSNVGLAEHLTRWEPYRATADFHTVEQYIGFFEQFLPEAARLFVLNQEALVQDKTIRFVIDYLDRHYMETIFVDMLAEKLNLTGGYLSSYFKSKTGTNLTDYVNQLRVSKAKALLTDPQLKIQNVAEQVGYQNINTFIRTFKRYTGYTPGDYRKTI